MTLDRYPNDMDTKEIHDWLDALREQANKASLAQREITGNYVLTDADLEGGVALIFNSASAVTLTINAGLKGAQPCTVLQRGEGRVTVVAGSGVTLNSEGSHLSSRARYAVFSIAPYTETSGSYFLFGALATV